MLSGMHFALLTEMLQWGTGNCEWDFGGGEYEEVQEMHMADAYSALKATLRPYGDSSAEPGIEVGFDKFSEWEEHIASIFPTKGTDYDPVIVREQTLDHTVKGCATAGGGDTTHIHGMKWHVIDMDLVALEQWSRRIESRAKMRFNRLYYTFRNLSEEDYDATEKVDQEYMATRNAY